MDGGMDGGMNGGMDGGMDGGWTLGGIWVDGTQKPVTEGGRDGHGSWMGWSRKVDSMRSKSIRLERVKEFPC